MATAQHIRVWVKLEDGVQGRENTTVSVPSDAFVDIIIEAALLKVKQKYDVTLVAATFKGKKLKRDHGVSSLTTSCDEPIVLMVGGAYYGGGTIYEELRLVLNRFSHAGTDFMSALLSATLSEDGDIMTFSMPPPWAYKKYHSLYIRKCYKDLHDIIWKGDQNMVVIGNPGIGKSFFAVYELYRALKEGKTVVFQSVPVNKTFLFRPGAAVKELLYPNAPALSETGQTVLLYDADTGCEPQYPSTRDRIIVLSSPYEPSYQDLLKEGATMLYMPTWSWDEIEYCTRSMDSYSSLDMPLVCERFKKYGGIARFVFEVDEYIAQKHLFELERAMLHCNMSILHGVIGAQDRHERGDKILHHTVVVRDDGTPDYCDYYFEFSSKYVEEKVYEVMKTRIGIFLHDCRWDPHTAMIRGSLFKRMAHNILANGGKFKIRKLVEGNKKEEEIKIKRKKKDFFKSLDDVHADHNKYLVPEANTYKAVDAIAPPGTAFLMTTDTSCTLDADEIKSVLKFGKPPSSRRFRLYIVVPDDMFDHFTKPQTYTYVDHKEKTAENYPPSVVDQYALCIPLVN